MMKSINSMREYWLLVVGLGVMSLAPASLARAATYYWDGNTSIVNNQSDNTNTTAQNWLSDGFWDDGTNSAALGSWASGDSAVFGGSAASQTITAGTFTVGNLTFGQGPTGSGTSGTAYTVNSGTLTLSSSTITANTNTTIGSNLTGTTTTTKAGSGALTLSGSNSYTGAAGNALVVNAGAVNLTNSNSLGVGNIYVGNTAGNAVVNLSGSANVTLAGGGGAGGQTVVGVVNGANGALKISAGTFSSSTIGGGNVDSNFLFGRDAGSYGYLDISGGSATAYRWQFGGGASGTQTGTGVGLVSSGTHTNNEFLIIGRQTGALGSFTLTSGATVNRSSAVQNLALAFSGGTGILNMQGGTLNNTGRNLSVRQGNTGTATGIVNLNGGTLTTNAIAFNAAAGSAAYLNFNGGTLQAGAATQTLIPNNFTRVTVNNLGGTIDNGGLAAITVAGNLLAPAGNGVTTIPVTNGGSGYVGAPFVTISGGGGSAATAIANMVDDGSGNGTFSIGSFTITNPGVSYTSAPTVTLTGGGGSGVVLGTPTTAALTSGGMTFTGTGTTILTGTNTYTGNTTVSQGTLTIGGTGYLYGSVSNSATISIASGATLSVTSSVVNALGYGSGATWAVSGTLNNTTTNTLSLPGNITLNNGTIAAANPATGTNGQWGNYFFNGVPATHNVTANGASNAITATSLGINAATAAFNTPLATDALSISSAIGFGSNINGSVSKSGLGTVTLSGANIYSGSTTITQGTLKLGAAGTIPNGPGKGNVVFSTAGNTATLDINGFDTTINGLSQATASNTNRVVNNASATTKTLTVGNNNATSTFAGIIADNTGTGGTLALAKTGTGTLTLTNFGNNFTGGTTVNQGTLALAGGGSGTGIIRGTLTINSGGTVTPQVSGTGWGLGYANSTVAVHTININGGQLLFSTNAGFGGTAASTINMTGGTIGGGGGGNTFDWYFGITTSPVLNTSASAGAATISANLNLRLNGNSNPLTFNVAEGTADPDLLVSGNITATGNEPGGRIVKTGLGKAVFSGANTYSGTTTVSNGTLLVNGTHTGGAAYTVASGATLGGTGSTASAVNISGTLSPGASIESLASGALTMNSGSTFVFEAVDNTSTGADLMAVNNALSLTNVNLDLTGANLAAGTWTVGDKLTLISYNTNTVTSGFIGYANDTIYTFGTNQWLFKYDDGFAGNNYQAQAEATGSQFVTMTLVPEPSSLATMVFGMISLMLLFKSKRRMR